MHLSSVVRGFAVVGILSLVGVFMVSAPERAEALSGSDFDAGNIISDGAFYSSDAMSQAEIQGFLDAKIGTCQNSLCLNVLKVDTPTTTLAFGTCFTYPGEANESAARIIFKVQQACSISAKVLLVTLQKEQGLVTSRAPTASVLRKALGQGCPDTAACDSAFYGFFIQVFSAARQFAWYGNPQGSHTSIKVGQYNPVRFHPNADCGSGSVLISNRATAALYYYTPYQPNTAALANLGGIGDACSSYGNRNFWVYYNNWFGSPTGNRNPIGNIEVSSATPGAFRVAGWVLDPDTSEPLDIHVYVDALGSVHTANQTRNDVANIYPGLGVQHGFDVSVPIVSTGVSNVCVYGMNKGPGANVLLGCQSMTALGGSPVGYLDSAVGQTGGIKVSGWSIDPDVANPVDVHLYVDAIGKAISANGVRADIGKSYPLYGNNHGFSADLVASPGSHDVCAYALNVGLGGTTVLGCQTVTVPGTVPIIDQGRAPIGNLEGVAVASDGVTVTGWALDPDTSSSIPVHVYVDSVGGAYTANKNRADIAAVYPAYGALHGLSEKVAAAPGAHNVCVYAINTGAGGHSLLGCKSITIPGNTQVVDQGRAPIGNLEGVAVASDGVMVTGWALDPDTSSSIPVHVYVDSVGGAYTANK
ncbi:hypothetical protein RCH23_002739, partial [Cryobacterium sp. CAN_C3]|nr:hypothetical protein [Cryobacterium sp. CAN_C3]